MSSYCKLRFPKEVNRDLVKMKTFLSWYLDSFELEDKEVSVELTVHEMTLSEAFSILSKFKKHFGIPYYYVVHGII